MLGNGNVPYTCMGKGIQIDELRVLCKESKQNLINLFVLALVSICGIKVE